MIFLVVVALLLEAEHLRRRRAIFLTWAQGFAEQEPVAQHAIESAEEQLRYSGDLLRQETEKPGTTGQSIAELSQEVADLTESAKDSAEMLQDFRDFRKRCERAASRPWEDPWPLRMSFWPTLKYGGNVFAVRR